MKKTSGLLQTERKVNIQFIRIIHFVFSTCLKHFPDLSSFMTYHWICNQSNTAGATSGAGTAYPSGAPEFTPSFQCGSCYSIFSSMCMLSRSLFVLLYLFSWYCLTLFDLRILITPLVSSNSSYIIIALEIYNCYSRYSMFIMHSH